MNGSAFDAFARHAAAAVSRRTSLLTLGGAALTAAIAAPVAANANEARKKVKKKCKKQGKQCRSATIEVCEGNQNCVDSLVPCCAFLARCKAGAYLDCFFSQV